MSNKKQYCHPERSAAESRDLRFAGIVTLSEQPQILRLRARPTRNSSGSEILCGRSAQDDNSNVHE